LTIIAQSAPAATTRHGWYSRRYTASPTAAEGLRRPEAKPAAPPGDARQGGAAHQQPRYDRAEPGRRHLDMAAGAARVGDFHRRLHQDMVAIRPLRRGGPALPPFASLSEPVGVNRGTVLREACGNLHSPVGGTYDVGRAMAPSVVDKIYRPLCLIFANSCS
jgi:hypothetical protein